MPESSPITAEVYANLKQIAQLLREPHQLGPHAQQSLAKVVAELEHALETGAAPPAEMTHLRDSTAQVLEALRQHHDSGLLAAASDRLQQTITSAETHAPFTVGMVRRVLDALANVGI